jgi:hypothetical protein
MAAAAGSSVAACLKVVSCALTAVCSSLTRPPQSAVARVDSAAAAAGSCVRLVAVSKLKPAADVQVRPCRLLLVEQRATA